MQQEATQRPVYLGFASQKGGVGKSSLAEVLSSILYYEKGIPLLVVDCDGTQESFFKLRERERTLIEDDPETAKHLQSWFHRFGKPSYRIVRSTPERALQDAAANEAGCSLVVFDFPGHAGTQTLLELSVSMDYIISPIEPDPQSLVSAFAYATTVRDLGVDLEEARIKDLFLLWNKINRSASPAVQDTYTRHAREEELSLFDASIYHTVKFARELGQGGVRGVFRSSYLPPVPALRTGTGVDEWVDETIAKLNLKPARP